MALELLGKGAEAKLYKNNSLVVKERSAKRYRIKEIDTVLRTSRTKREAKLLSYARQAGIPTPFIYSVDNKNATLKMKYIPGEKLKYLIENLTSKERREIFETTGRLAGTLHKGHIIHGDMTTSNMIFWEGRVYLIDFGLGEINESLESKGTDLLVFRKTLRSTHYRFEDEALKAFKRGYLEAYPRGKDVWKRLKTIEKRGRYFASRI